MTMSQTQPLRADALAGDLVVPLAIPAGFLIESTAYAAFVRETGLERRIADVLDDLDVEDPAALLQAATDVRLGIEMTSMPVAVRTAVVDAHAALFERDEAVTVAARPAAGASAAALEILAHLSDRSLRASGIVAVLDAVQRCWASLFSARAIRLRSTLGLAHRDLDVAVVVRRHAVARDRRSCHDGRVTARR